jgi:hypothetical protein
MKKHYAIIFMLVMSAQMFAQTNIPTGMVYGTWTFAGSPYLINGSIMIPNDSTLSIQSGVTVNFQGLSKLNVQGRLLAIGSLTDSIFFTSLDTSNGWRGIRFTNTSNLNDTSRIEYCVIQNCKASGPSPEDNGGAVYLSNFSKLKIKNSCIKKCSANQDGGAIYCSGASPRIENNIIKNNNTIFGGGGGIYCINSSPIISQNVILNNINGSTGSANGGGIHCSTNSNAVIIDNVISYNISNNLGGGIHSISNCQISGNIINNNIAGYGGGIDCASNPSIIKNKIHDNIAYGGAGIQCQGSPTISYNSIYNNIADAVGGGINCNTSYIPLIDNNLIANNSISNASGTLISGGCGINITTSNAILTNNTIVNNDGLNGGAVRCHSASPTFINNILWGNTASSGVSQIFLYDEASDPNFYFCSMQGGTAAFGLNGNFYTGIYQSNIDSNPMFVSPSAGSGNTYNGLTADWSLQSVSPCVNSGNPIGTYPATDIAGNPRQVCRIDMGAYEYQVGDIVTPTISINGNDTICQGNSVTITSTDGNSYQWNNNATTQTITASQSGIYTVTITDANGCSGSDSVAINVINISVAITQSNDTLSANQVNATYQWIDCSTNTIIANEINQTFIPSTNGNYAVVVSQNGCADTSDCIAILTTQIESKTKNATSNISIFPNPTKSTITIKTTNPSQIKIQNILGEEMLNTKIQNTEILDISNFAAGIYFVYINPSVLDGKAGLGECLKLVKE